MNKDEKLWKQYDQHIVTYKFYLEILVKLMTMYFAVSGAMLSFYFTKVDIPTAKLALYLPWLMSVGLFFFFLLGLIYQWLLEKMFLIYEINLN